MDTEQPTSASSNDLIAALQRTPVPFESLRGPEAALSGARVIPLHKRDTALAEEVQAATRIANGVYGGDSDAETAMVDRYSRGLRYLLVRRIGDDERARDLLQETFCIAIEKLRNKPLDSPERLAGYLRGIAIRVALNAGRRRSREPYPIDTLTISAIPDHEPRQFQKIAKEQTTSAVHKLLNAMPVERDRELLIRLYVYDQDRKEICHALGLDSLHFNRVLFRAKGRFRKILEESGDIKSLMPTKND